jgi:predicted ATPase/Tfp pilus assembly protein PilF
MRPHAPQTRFVGRSDDLERLAALYAAHAPLVTLWGPPGIGKTRLALELCRYGRLSRDGAAAVWFCDLCEARDTGSICEAVARGLGVEAPPTRVTPGWVAAALAGCAPGVVVLDNFEQITAFGQETVGLWTKAAAHIFFVVTSRERLRIAAEITHEVLPLGTEAAELFLDRARAWTRLAEQRATDVDAVNALVTRLEGIPLAIELAAARVDVLGVEGLLARLDHPLDLLRYAPRDSTPNHATLRLAIDSSYALLSRTEQRTLGECAVFRGGFSLAAAEAVVTSDDACASVLDTLQALRDRSLLRCFNEGGEVRFAFFEALRAFATEGLAATGEEAAVQERHARYFLDPKANLPLADQENIVEAARWALERSIAGAPVVPSRDLVASLARLEPSRVSQKLVVSLEEALRVGEKQDWSSDVLASGQRARGRALQLHGRLTDARAALELALTLAVGHDHLAAEIWENLGLLHHQCRRIEEARTCYQSALSLQEKLDDAVGRARTLGHLGALYHDTRHYDEALDHYERALNGFRSAGERRLEGIFLTNKGVLLQERGAFAQARASYLAGLARIGPTGDRRLEGITHTNLGFLQHEAGFLEEAHASHVRALEAFREVVDPCSEGLCAGRLAMALAALGHGRDARLFVQRAERLLAHIDDVVAMGVLRLFEVFVDANDSDVDDVVRDRVAAARTTPVIGGAALVDISDDARTAVRLIENVVAARGVGATRGMLLVAADAGWFTTPGGQTCDLGRRDVLRRLLLRLVEQHRRAPAEGLTLDALREAGWPSEQIIEAAAVNRIHVALAELRRRGLKQCLVRKRDKYLIDPALRVVLSDA